MKFIFYFAIIGWLSALVVHVLSIANVDSTAGMPVVWILHAGIFVVWLPMIFYLKKNEEVQAFYKLSKNQRSAGALLKVLFKHTPDWLKVLAVLGFLYMPVNFFLSVVSQHGSPDLKDGQYILHSHGKLIRILTEQEYHHYKANEIRGFSGHWLGFYGIAAAILFPLRKQTSMASVRSGNGQGSR